ncbi:MAG: C-GCAxxG-C-C family protein [Coriobacteriia bacterium]|nr:C-GCAxxG-C-C family protein [Coriobacteriia bacterium]
MSVCQQAAEVLRVCEGQDPSAIGRALSVDAAGRAEAAAAAYYQSGLWCGESVVKAVNEALGRPMPEGIHRLASGFCEGLGGSRCICGALAGAVMATGIVFGREHACDPWEPSYDAAGELRRRWVAYEGAETCSEVAERHGGMESPRRWAHCAELVGLAARWVVEIAAERSGFRP